MDALDLYKIRVFAKGSTKRNAILQRERRTLTRKLPDSLSHKNVVIEGVERWLEIIDSDNLDTKTIHTLPGEDIECGAIVDWAENRWIVTEKDANTELYAKAKMRQCNYLLKWINDAKEICEQWCIVEDGTKYLTGEIEDRNIVITRGDSRIALILPRTTETIKLGRTSRFLIDDPLADDKIAYTLSKPLKIGQVYNGKGVFGFVLQEVQATDYDNMELGIADYYRYFNKSGELIDSVANEPGSVLGKKVWI